jgi:hypothetical protein
MTALQTYRDDGLLSDWIGATAGRALRIGEVPLTLLGAVVLGLALAIAGRPVPDPVLAVAVAVVVVLVGAGARRSHSGRFAWIVPPLLRLLEYAFLIRLTVLADPDAMPLCFALLSALAFHHYDTVYRLRQQGVAPPAWTRAIGGGWEGRLVVGVLLAALGVLAPGMLVAAVILGAVYVTESTLSWMRFARATRPAVIDDEEAEDE